VNRLRQLWHYLDKVFDLSLWVRQVRDRRVYPVIPTPALHFSLLSGALLRIPSLLDLSLKTRGPGWQRMIGHGAISDDALGYVLEHGRPEDWRRVLGAVNRKLKANKQFEPNISGTFTDDGRFAGVLTLSGDRQGYACGGEYTFIAVHG